MYNLSNKTGNKKVRLPAIHAVRKHATFPQIIARTTICDNSDFLVGARAPKPPNVIPIEPKFAKPHKAYVAIISDFSCNSKKKQNVDVYLEKY